MPIEITMPRLSDTMEVGTVIKWNVKEGDEVSAGDVLADIETDKATMELQAYDDGTIAKIVAGEGDSVEVGKLIAVLAEEGEDAADAAKAAEGAASGAPKAKAEGADDASSSESSSATATEPASTERNGAAPSGGEASARSGNGRIFASPLARKVAEEKGVDLSRIEGSGPSGRIVKKDVEAAASGASAPAQQAAPAPAMAPAERLEAKSVSLSNMRKTIAKRLVESKTTVPHYQVTLAVNMDPLLALRKQLNEQLQEQGVKLSVNDFLVRACALAMHQHPFVNSSWKGDAIQINGEVNVGVAIALDASKGGGLVVATLRSADRMGLRQISADTKRLAEKARSKGLTVEEMADSTFTISNLGMYGVEHFTAIINPPNSAILAVGGAVEKPVVRDGQIVVGHEMQMTMSSDHRVIDGAMAAEYLTTVKQFLEHPATLLV
ncbi:MAG: pyruvate dehydrogenase complex dihydrolipoamide acetyltransferase [Phycisphaerales bacterium]